MIKGKIIYIFRYCDKDNLQPVGRLSKMNKKYKTVLIIALILAVAGLGWYMFSSEASQDDIGETDEIEEIDDLEEVDEGNGISYEEEFEDAEIVKEKKESGDFIGSWTADSDQARYLYGNIDITINEDGIWDANVTEEDFKGTWKEDEYGITLTSDLLDCRFYFTDTGTLIMEDYRFEDNDEPIITVLKKK